MKEKILQLKKEKNAVILAHYYAPAEAQEVADYVGDSFYLAKIAKKSTADIIVFCGVSFMGESAKILNPDKKVLMPDFTADCPMAHMVKPGQIQKMREKYEDLAVVCYINSTAELKCQSDVCVTSSNAIKLSEHCLIKTSSSSLIEISEDTWLHRSRRRISSSTADTVRSMRRSPLSS